MGRNWGPHDLEDRWLPGESNAGHLQITGRAASRTQTEPEPYCYYFCIARPLHLLTCNGIVGPGTLLLQCGGGFFLCFVHEVIELYINSTWQRIIVH